MNFSSPNRDATIAFGRKLAALLKPGDIVCLTGDLGTGKTTLVKGLAQGLGIKPEAVNSPTFILMNFYQGKKLPVYHFDLYRLEDVKEILAIGFEEYLYGEGVSVIEWAERLKELAPAECLRIAITHRGENDREITLEAAGERYRRLLAACPPEPSTGLGVSGRRQTQTRTGRKREGRS